MASHPHILACNHRVSLAHACSFDFLFYFVLLEALLTSNGGLTKKA